jgi:hypothetical protein
VLALAGTMATAAYQHILTASLNIYGLDQGGGAPETDQPGGFGALTRDSAQTSRIALQFSQQIVTLMAEPTPRFGFVAFAETWNGRLAMLGFVIGLGSELLTGQGILGQLGLG